MPAYAIDAANQMAPADEAPSSGALATGEDGALLLILHSKSAQKATAVQLPNNPAEEQTAKVCGCTQYANAACSQLYGKHCSGPDHAQVALGALSVLCCKVFYHVEVQ